MKDFVLAVIVLALCSLSSAGTPNMKIIDTQQEAAGPAVQETATQAAPNGLLAATRGQSNAPNVPCQHLFTVNSSTSNVILQYCVTDNGNIVAGASLQSAFACEIGNNRPWIRLQLQNAGTWKEYQHGFVQSIPAGTNPCAFALTADPYGVSSPDQLFYGGDASINYTYVATVPALKNVTATVSYRGM